MAEDRRRAARRVRAGLGQDRHARLDVDRRLQLQRRALRARGSLLARRRPALRGRVGRGSLPRHLPAPRLGLRPRDRPPLSLPAYRAGRDVPGRRRGRGRQGGSRDRDAAGRRPTSGTTPTTTRSGAGPSATSAALYERLCLEGFQSGLSWLTILRKREGFRAAFEGFDPDAGRGVSASATSSACSADASIVRHRGKIEATIANARATVALRETDAAARALLGVRAGAARRPTSPSGLAGARRPSRPRSRRG